MYNSRPPERASPAGVSSSLHRACFALAVQAQVVFFGGGALLPGGFFLLYLALGAGQPHGDDFLVLHNVYLQCKSAPLVIASASRAGFIPSSGISPPDLLLRFLQFACGSQIIRTLRTYRTPVFNSPAVKPRCRSSRARGGLRAGTDCWSVRGCTRGGSR